VSIPRVQEKVNDACLRLQTGANHEIIYGLLRTSTSPAANSTAQIPQPSTAAI